MGFTTDCISLSVNSKVNYYKKIIIRLPWMGKGKEKLKNDTSTDTSDSEFEDEKSPSINNSKGEEKESKETIEKDENENLLIDFKTDIDKPEEVVKMKKISFFDDDEVQVQSSNFEKGEENAKQFYGILKPFDLPEVKKKTKLFNLS